MAEPHTEENRATGRRIAAARRTAHLTQAELASRIGWPRDTLINIEHGRRPITVERLIHVAAALELPPATLLISDTRAAHLVARLLSGTEELRDQVAFFLDSLEATEMAESH
jgi:transcriptional regulator with XRE-family HTH domain